MTNLLVKRTIILSDFAKKFLYLFKNKNICNFVIFVAAKIVVPTKIFPLLFLCCYRIRDRAGSGMEDKNQDPGFGIKIPDLQTLVGRIKKPNLVRTISLRFLGIILRVLRLEVSVWIS
jgi:hypothetical protein